jgi:hypothetical protein
MRIDLQVADNQARIASEDQIGIRKHRVHVVQASPIGIAGIHLSNVLQGFAAAAAVPKRVQSFCFEAA